MSQQTTSQEIAVLKGLLRKLAVDEAYEEARAVGRRLVELVQNDPDIWYLFGHVQARLGEYDPAIDCLRKALDLAGPGVELAVEMCYIDSGRGDLKSAIDWCRRGLELEPANPDLTQELARLYVATGETEQAVPILEVFLRMPAAGPEDMRAVREQLAHVCMRLRRYDDALAYFRMIAETDDSDNSVWANIGHCLSRKGEKQEALEAFERAAKILPDARNLYNLGDAHLALGQPDKAVGPLKDALRMDPDHALARYDLGRAYYDLGRFEEAEVEARDAIADDPDMLRAEMNLGLSAMTNAGLSLMRQQKYEEAILCFKKNEKEFAATYYNMGLALYRANRYREAMDYIKRACAIEPKDSEFLDLLGQTYDMLGKYREAEKHLRRSIELAPNYADSYYDLGNMFLKIKDKRKEARTLLEKAIELKPDMTWAYYCLGCWYALEGKKTKAFEYLEKAIEKGFNRRKWMEEDKDLDGLKGDPRYRKMVARLPKVETAKRNVSGGGAAAAPVAKKKKKGNK